MKTWKFYLLLTALFAIGVVGGHLGTSQTMKQQNSTPGWSTPAE